jgi:hypothetical protein
MGPTGDGVCRPRVFPPVAEPREGAWDATGVWRWEAAGRCGCVAVDGDGCWVRWGKRQGETVGLAGSGCAWERKNYRDSIDSVSLDLGCKMLYRMI